MKKAIKTTISALCVTASLMVFSACSIIKRPTTTSTQNKTVSFTVNYYDNKTMEYTSTAGQTVIKTNFIAPSGKYIKGLYDENDVQYSDYDCIVSLANNAVIPPVLYAKYEDVDISYLNDDPFEAWVEDPKLIGFYKAKTLTWEFNAQKYSDDKKMIAACLCNPYADLTIKVSFTGKGDGGSTWGDNKFISQLIVCNEVIGSFSKIYLGDSYAEYTYSGTIKAKQFTNGNYQTRIKMTSSYGREDHTIKNVKIDYKFKFASDET